MPVSVEGKEVPSAHYTRHAAEEPSGLREDIDVYEPEGKVLVQRSNHVAALRTQIKSIKSHILTMYVTIFNILYLDDNTFIYEDAPDSNDGEDGEDEYDSGENELANLIFNRKGRLDVKKPGPFFPNSANNFFLNKVTLSVSLGLEYNYYNLCTYSFMPNQDLSFHILNNFDHSCKLVADQTVC